MGVVQHQHRAIIGHRCVWYLQRVQPGQKRDQPRPRRRVGRCAMIERGAIRLPPNILQQQQMPSRIDPQ